MHKHIIVRQLIYSYKTFALFTRGLFSHLWTDDVYIRACKFLPPKRRMTYIYAFLVLANRRMPFIYAKVLNEVLLDLQGFLTGGGGGGKEYPTKGEKGKRIPSASG